MVNLIVYYSSLPHIANHYIGMPQSIYELWDVLKDNNFVAKLVVINLRGEEIDMEKGINHLRVKCRKASEI